MRVLVAPLQRLLFHRTSSLADHWAFHDCCHSTWLGATAAHAATLARPVTPRQPTGWKRLRRFAGLASSLGQASHRLSAIGIGAASTYKGILAAPQDACLRKLATRITAESLHGSHTKPRTSRRAGCDEWLFTCFRRAWLKDSRGFCSCTQSFLGVVRAKFENTAIERASPPLPFRPSRSHPAAVLRGRREKEARRIMRCATAAPACRCASASLAGPHHFARHSRANTTLYLKPSSKSSSEPA